MPAPPPLRHWLAALLVPLALAAPASAGEDGPNLLLIGDSHTYGTFGTSLDARLREVPGARVKMAGSCGQTSFSFLHGWRTRCGLRVKAENGWGHTEEVARTPRINRLLRFRDGRGPDLTVIALGANHIGKVASERGRRRIADGINRLLERVLETETRCLWVGPPTGLNKSFEHLELLYETIQGAIDGRCAFFDSRPSALPYLDYRAISDAIYERTGRRRGDGAHYDHLGRDGREALRRWSGEVFDAAASML